MCTLIDSMIDLLMVCVPVLLDDGGKDEHDGMAEDEEQGVDDHIHLGVQWTTPVPQSVLLPVPV